MNYSPTNGQLASIVNTNSGVGVQYAYDLMDRREQINWTDAASNTLRGLDYGFDALGMITNITTEAGEKKVYVYDTINRLTEENHYSASDTLTYSAAYKFDLAGNRTQTVINGVTNDYTLGTGNRLASWGGNGSALYDAAGNTTNPVSTDGRELTLDWNERYQLTNSTILTDSTTSTVSYAYDVLGRRTSRTCHSPLATNEVHFVYNGNQVAADLDENGELIRSYTWGPGIDNLLSMTVHGATETNTYYALKDHQNSVLALTDAAGNVVESYSYDAYGCTTIFDSSGNALTSDLGLPTSAVGNRYLWQGREYDSETGLYYFRARWYSPETGRWLSKDPIGISGGLNLYAFCGNNPVNFVDPFGLCEGKSDYWSQQLLKPNPKYDPLGNGPEWSKQPITDPGLSFETRVVIETGKFLIDVGAGAYLPTPPANPGGLNDLSQEDKWHRDNSGISLPDNPLQ